MSHIFFIISSSKIALENRDWMPRIRPTRVGGFLCAQFDLDLFALSGGQGNDGYDVKEREHMGDDCVTDWLLMYLYVTIFITLYIWYYNNLLAIPTF